MAELTINPADITAALRQRSTASTPRSSPSRSGRIIEVGDGIARVSGLPGAAVNELLEFEGGSLGLALNLDEDSIGAVVLGEVAHIQEGQSVKATGEILVDPGRRRPARPRRQRRSASRSTARARSPTTQHPPCRDPGAGHREAQAGEGADADRHQGDRRHDADRPWPARADHRRPQDRQDRGRDRHDHQPEGPRREVHLRRHRPEGLDRRRDRARPSKTPAPWSTPSS